MKPSLTEEVVDYFILHNETLKKELHWELLKNKKREAMLRISGEHRKQRRNRQIIKWAVDKGMRDLGLNFVEASSIIDEEFLGRMGLI